MEKDFRYYASKSVAETQKWLEEALYDPDLKFLKTITNNEMWHGDNHIHKTKEELLDSVLSKEKTADSRFIKDKNNDENLDTQVAYNLTDALSIHMTEIQQWRFGDNTPSRLKITAVLDEDSVVGVGYIYNEETKKVETRKTNAISIVLQKSTSNEYGIDAVTAYPELQNTFDKNMENVFDNEMKKVRYAVQDKEAITIKPNGVIRPETVENTETYKNASELKMEKIMAKCQNINKFMDYEPENNEDIEFDTNT